MVKSKTTVIRKRDDQESKRNYSDAAITEYKGRMKLYEWSMGHLYPDIYEPVRSPDQYQFPTHIMTSKFQRTLTIPTTRDFSIYFSPITDCYYNYQYGGAGGYYSNINVAFGPDVFYSYADNNSQRTDAVSGTPSKCVFDVGGGKPDLFANLGNWNYATKGSDSLKKFKKIRLLGAYIRITYTGKAEDLSGTVRVAMGVRSFTTPFTNDSINVDDLINMPQFKTMTLAKPIICRYRVTHDDFMDFGPYSPYSSTPYFLIYGKGLQDGSSVFVEVVKHFEGVVIPEEEEFISPIRASRDQLPLLNQMELVKKHGHNGAIDVHQKIEEEELDDLMNS